MPKLDRPMAIVMGLTILLIVGLVATMLAAPSPSTGATGSAGASRPIETMTARVTGILEEGTRDLGDGTESAYQKLLVLVESGSLSGQEIVVEEGVINTTSEQKLFRPGDRVYLDRVPGPEGDHLYISDYIRSSALFWVFAIFAVLVVLVGWGKGVRSLAGTGFSLLVIFGFVVPRIMGGDDPLTVSLVGALVLLTVSTYLVFGWNMKAHAAVAGMLLSLLVTGLLASAFVGWTRLTGFGSEESTFLLMDLGPGVNLRGIVLGGIIIGALGVLDDICVGQSSSVFELAQANPNLSSLELFRRSLNIGRDHISASVNTLVLAYVGASLPLLMVFTIYQEPLLRRLNREPIAEEIVRTLVGSIGLVLAVPITSLIASFLAPYARQQHEEALARLLVLVSDGKSRSLAQVAHILNRSQEETSRLLEELAERGHLVPTRGTCPGGECRGCRYRLACAVGDQDRIWTLAPTSGR